MVLFAQMGTSQSCTIYFTAADSFPDGTVWITAHLTGTNPGYQWSTGETGPTIVVSDPGSYLVTATNAEGCSISSGYVAECETVVRQVGASMKAYKVLGGANLTYLWSTGSTDQTIYPTQSGDYCVTITGSNNCTGTYANSRCNYFYVFNSCSTYINYNSDNTLTATTSGEAPFTYQWSPGNYTSQTINPGTPGTYCVTVTDATGCVSYDCRYLYDPGQCEVNIYLAPDSSATGILVAETDGQWWNDWQYNWSNGENSPSIQPLTGGNYCVTVTNTQTGCTSSSCYWYWPDSLCSAQITLDSVGTYDAFLSVSGIPFPIVSYQWDNGGTNAVNQTLSGGWQSVTITNNQGCSASASYYLYESQSLVVTLQFPDSINFGNNGVHAEVYLIEYDTAQGGILTAVDTIQTYSWTDAWALGQFEDIQPGLYLVKAALLPNSNGYNEHLPTYYQQAAFWNAATPYAYQAFGPLYPSVNIIMVPGQNPGGPGFIGGLVSQGANVHGHGNHADFGGSGDPMPGVSVVLTLADGTPVAAAVTDANGQYAFSNIAWGTYKVTLDIPGLPLAEATVTIGPDNPAVQGLNFIADENSIALPVKEADLKKEVSVYPNPTQDLLYVVAPNQADITLTDALGKAVWQENSAPAKTKISMGDLNSGLYFLSVRSAGSIEIVKVMKQ